MSEEEAAERELQSRRIYQSRATLSAGTEWTSATNTVFDGTYRHILGAASERAKQRPALDSDPHTLDACRDLGTTSELLALQ